MLTPSATSVFTRHQAFLAESFAVVALLLTACGDATGPQGSLELRVSADTVRINPATGTVLVPYTFRNDGDAELKTTFHAEVQGELPTGEWRKITDADDVLYFEQELSFRVQAGYTGQRAGEYRLG